MNFKIKQIIWFVTGVLACIGLDQWTKALAAAQLTDVVDVLIPGWLELRYLLNDGMALSMFRGGRWVFVALTVVFFDEDRGNGYYS